ncbi:MAG: hypothetical protein RSP_10300 [Rhodanobacter sp.]
MKLAMIPQAHPRWLVVGMLAATVAIVSGGLDAIGRQQAGGMASLYGREDGHDRLLVVDPQAGRLTVYDAVSGRPLQHLDADAAAEMLDRHDGRVVMLLADGTRSQSASLQQP